MGISRRIFFKGVGLALGAFGLGGLVNAKAEASSTEMGGARSLEGKVGVEWLGHGSFLFVSCEGIRILLDPWLATNPNCPDKYRRPGGFEKMDYILWTHGHVDHFMLSDARDLIEEYQPKVIAPWELSFFIKSEIPEAECLTFTLANKGATSDLDGIRMTMVEAFHSAGAQLTGFQGTNRFVGEAVGYVLEFENGLKIYHSGDTSLMGDMKTIIGDYYQPDIAILPIGGVFTMGPEEAAHACALIKPEVVIPEHFATFPVLEQSAEGFKQAVARRTPSVKVLELKPGVMVEI